MQRNHGDVYLAKESVRENTNVAPNVASPGDHASIRILCHPCTSPPSGRCNGNRINGMCKTHGMQSSGSNPKKATVAKKEIQPSCSQNHGRKRQRKRKGVGRAAALWASALTSYAIAGWLARSHHRTPALLQC